MQKNVRATLRAAGGLAAIPVVLGLAALQRVLVGPVFRNYTAIPKVIAGMVLSVLGYKVELNETSAPVVRDKPVLFVANHQSQTDHFVLASVIDGSFVGKESVLRVPVVSEFVKAFNYIGVRRKSAFNAEARGKIINVFNKSRKRGRNRNVILYPEATTDSSKEVRQFHAAYPKLFYDVEDGNAVDKNGNPVKLEVDAVIQPVALRVKSVNGEPAGPDLTDAENDRIRNLYCNPGDGRGLLGSIWKRLQLNTTLEVTVFAALDPHDKAFPDAETLLNQAALEVASVVNPGQDEFTKARRGTTPQQNFPAK